MLDSDSDGPVSLHEVQHTIQEAFTARECGYVGWGHGHGCVNAPEWELCTLGVALQLRGVVLADCGGV